MTILAIIRQAMDNFQLEETAGSMLKLMGAFHKQWDLFVRSMDKMGKKIDEAQSEFQGLTTTRRNQLERPLRQIEDLRLQKGLEAEALIGNGDVIPTEAEEIAESCGEDEKS